MKFLKSLFKKTISKQQEEKSYNPYVTFTAGMCEANWTRYHYNALCEHGFNRNPVVYACIKMLAEGAARVPFMVQGDKNITPKNKQYIIDLLDAPSEQCDGRSFRISLFSSLFLTGNAYIDCVFDDTQNQLCSLFLLRSDRVSVVTESNGYISGYHYKSGKQQKRYDKSRLIHLKLYAPDDDYYGTSGTMAAWRAIELHNQATIFEKSLLDNAARPSGCLVYNGLPGAPNLTEAQFIRLREELQENYTGSAAAGRPMILEGGLEWKQISLTPQDIGLSRIRHDTSREIALAYGVPPMLLGIPGDNTYSNYQEAVRAFARNTLIPAAELFYHAFARKVSQITGTRIQIDVDYDKVPMLFSNDAV